MWSQILTTLKTNGFALKLTVTVSPIFNGAPALAVLPLIDTLLAAQASCAIVRLFRTRLTFKNLSIRIIIVISGQ